MGVAVNVRLLAKVPTTTTSRKETMSRQVFNICLSRTDDSSLRLMAVVWAGIYSSEIIALMRQKVKLLACM